MMNEQKLKDLAAEFDKGVKTEKDLNQFTRLLTKITVETAINAEQLGHEKMLVKTVLMPVMVIPVRPSLMMVRLKSQHHETLMAHLSHN